jgi:hypothetical protein
LLCFIFLFKVNSFHIDLVSFVFSVVVSYSPDQIRKMEESVQIRIGYKPAELIKSVRTKIKN